MYHFRVVCSGGPGNSSVIYDNASKLEITEKIGGADMKIASTVGDTTVDASTVLDVTLED